MGDQDYDRAVHRGFEALDRNELEVSLAAFEEASRLARNDRERASAKIQIGWRLQSLGRTEPALAAFREVVGNPEALAGEGFMAQMNVGWCLTHLGDAQASLEAFREALKLVTTPKDHAKVHMQMGWQLRELDRGEEAYSHFLEANQTEGAAPEVTAMSCLAIGWYFHDRGDTSAKLTWFGKAIDSGALQPEKVAECWWAIAGAREALGQLVEAKDAVEKMLAIPEVNPDFARDARPMLARLRQQVPDPKPSATESRGTDPREVICGMNGDIQWQPLLPPSGLEGLSIEGSWERDGESVVIRALDGSASLSFGEDDWEDYELDVFITPLEGGNAQLGVRKSYSGSYMIDMMLGWKAMQVARVRSHSMERLSVVDADVERHREYHVRVAVRGASITTYVDGNLVNQVTDFEMRRGKASLLAWHSVTRYRSPRFRALS